MKSIILMLIAKSLALMLFAASLLAFELLPLMATVTVWRTELNTQALPQGIALREDLELIIASVVEHHELRDFFDES